MRNRFILFVLLFLVLNIYIGWHGAVFLRQIGGMPPAAVYWLIYFAVALSYLLARLRFLPHPVRLALKIVGSYFFAMLEFAVMLLVPTDLAALLLCAFGVSTGPSVIVLGIAVIVLLAALMLRGSWNAWNPVTRSYDVFIPKQAGTHRELKIAVASDIHLGDIVGNRHLQRLVDRVREMKPDLILLPGDVIDDRIEPFIRHNMAEVMQQLQAPLGVYAVLGNHEYYGSQIEEYVQRMERIGVRVLRDETVLTGDSVYIAGRKDRTAEATSGRLPVAELLEQADRSLPVILMDHQPYGFAKAAQAGADLLLCGHTHRGQYAPNHWITRRLFELDWGYMKKEQMHVVVSSGFGTWGPPIRIASRSEIVELNVRFQHG
jgi:predicted MPP superfamily phosphohydrolase